MEETLWTQASQRQTPEKANQKIQKIPTAIARPATFLTASFLVLVLVIALINPRHLPLLDCEDLARLHIHIDSVHKITHLRLQHGVYISDGFPAVALVYRVDKTLRETSSAQVQSPA